MAASRTKRSIIVAPSIGWMLCLVVYLSRPWSCSFTLSRFSPEDAVPFANFDRHGFATMIGWAVALLFAPSVITLASRVLFVQQRPGPVPRGPCHSVFRWSAVIAFIVALPTFVQTAFIVRLPLSIVWPVLATSALWCVVVAAVWRHFIRRSDADLLAQKLRGQALAIAGLILLPKLALWIWVGIA